MIKLKLKQDNKIVYESDGLMLDVWDTALDIWSKGKETPNNTEIVIDELGPYEKEWLGRVLEWVYKDREVSTITVNGKEYGIDRFLDE